MRTIADTNNNATANPFARVNALVDSELANLTALELKVWLVFYRHADADGVSYPGPELVAAKTGRHVRSIYRAIRSLEKKGFLASPENKGGRSKVSRRIVEVPKTLTPAASVSEDRNSDTGAPETLTSARRNSDICAPETLTELCQRNNTGTTQRTAHQQHGADAAAAATSESDSEAIRAIRSLTFADGQTIRGVMPEKLIEELPGLTAAVVNDVARGLSDRAGAGAFISALRADGKRLIAEERENRQRAAEIAERLAEASARLDALMHERRALMQAQQNDRNQLDELAKSWLASQTDEQLKARIDAEGAPMRMLNLAAVKAYRHFARVYVQQWTAQEQPDAQRVLDRIAESRKKQEDIEREIRAIDDLERIDRHGVQGLVIDPPPRTEIEVAKVLVEAGI